MPYGIRRGGKDCPYEVHNSETGERAPGGCHPTRQAALAHQRAMMRNVPDAAVVAANEPQGGEHFHSIAHTEGQSTGRRTFTNLTWREPPFSFHWQEGSSAHGGTPMTVQVGLVERVERDPVDPSIVHAWGSLDLGGPKGREYARQLVAGFQRWVSIGLDESPFATEIVWPDTEETTDDDDVSKLFQEPEQILIDGGCIGELTGVSVPAQNDATIEPTPELIRALDELGDLDIEVTDAAIPPQFVKNIKGGKDKKDEACPDGQVWDNEVGECVPEADDKAKSPNLPAEWFKADVGDAAGKGNPYHKGKGPGGGQFTTGGGGGKSSGGKSSGGEGSSTKGTQKSTAPKADENPAHLPENHPLIGAKIVGRSRSTEPGTPGAIREFKVRLKDGTESWAEEGSMAWEAAGGAQRQARRGNRTDVMPAEWVRDAGDASDLEDCPEGQHWDDMMEKCVDDESMADVIQGITAAAYRIEIPDLPPASWFEEPNDVEIPGAFCVTDDGRLFGILAPLQANHRAFARAGRRMTVPHGNVDYSRFLGGEALTTSGRIHNVGPITMDCRHASRFRADHDVAPDHYENACAVVGKVRVGETAQGLPWVAGALEPGVTPDQLSRMLACRLSGDWQPHADRHGWQELVACLLVPAPGFPMARTGPTITSRQGALVASSVPVRYVGDGSDQAIDGDPVEALTAAATLAGRTEEARRARRLNRLLAAMPIGSGRKERG